VEHLLHVHLPVAAERLPGVTLKRPRQRARPGTQHQRAGAVRIEKLAGDDRIGRVSDDGEEGAAELGAQFAEPGPVAGDADHVRAGLAQRGGDRAAEAPAGAGDECCCS
jgi:hypothetical protein